MASGSTPSWSVRADYWVGARALGGRLTLGAGDLTFEPDAVERALGGRTSSRVPLDDIVSVEVHRRGAVPRRRMFVRTRGGTEAAFLIPRVEERADDICRAVDRAVSSVTAGARTAGHVPGADRGRTGQRSRVILALGMFFTVGNALRGGVTLRDFPPLAVAVAALGVGAVVQARENR